MEMKLIDTPRWDQSFKGLVGFLQGGFGTDQAQTFSYPEDMGIHR
jgi:hypothetical protein